MKQIILVRYGEIILKGLNRGAFEDKLLNNIRKALGPIGKASITKSQARITVEPSYDDYDYDLAISKLIRIFGIVSVSLAYKVESDLDVIKQAAVDIVKEKQASGFFPTFKAESKRGDKKFPLNSMEISAEVGGHVHDNCQPLDVDVTNPSFILYVEVRQFTYIYTEKIKAFGGMPTGTNGKAMLLLSGGIDSPVAGFMIGKRGVEIEAVHFYSYPYTSERAKEKVLDLAKILSSYCGRIKVHVVPFTEIQLAMRDNCPEDLLTIIMRRVMMQIAEQLARMTHCSCLVTGESIGQVASQTMQSLYITDMVANMPVFRPLIGMDKDEVIEIARKIDTFETSIQPYEDCCTVFVAKHPKTRPQLQEILVAEEHLPNIEEMMKKAISETEVVIFE